MDIFVEIIRPGYTYRDSTRVAAWMRLAHGFQQESEARTWAHAVLRGSVAFRLVHPNGQIIANSYSPEETPA